MTSPTPFKILHVYRSASFSGAESYALEVAAHHSHFHDVTFLTQPDSTLSKKIAANSDSRIKIVVHLLDLKLGEFDLIILHSTQELKTLWPALVFAKIKARLTGNKVPRVVVYSHIWISHSKKDPLHAIPYAVVDRFWCSSDQSRSALIRFLPLSPAKIEVVRYGRDTSLLTQKLFSKAEAREKLEIPLDAIVVGTLARVDKGKGSLELFEATTDLMQSTPNLHLLMIGPPTDGDPKATELDEELHRAIGKMASGIRSRIHKLGRLEQGTHYLPAFDLFVLATYKENFALTLLEAMAAKIPCLATDSGGSPDIVRPHSTGWLFLPASTESLRSTLLTALDQKEKWPAFGSNGQRLVMTGYDFKTVMNDLDSKIQSLVASRC